MRHLHDEDIAEITELLERLILDRLNQLGDQIMAAIDNLNQNITDLTTATNAAVAKIGEQNQDPALQDAADAVAAQTTALNNAVTPPAPAPAP